MASDSASTPALLNPRNRRSSQGLAHDDASSSSCGRLGTGGIDRLTARRRAAAGGAGSTATVHQCDPACPGAAVSRGRGGHACRSGHPSRARNSIYAISLPWRRRIPLPAISRRARFLSGHLRVHRLMPYARPTSRLLPSWCECPSSCYKLHKAIADYHHHPAHHAHAG